MPPTPITPAMLEQRDREIAELKKQLAKKEPKKLIPFGRIIPSKDHDFEAKLLIYKTDSNGKLIVEGNNGQKGYVFDPDIKPAIISTTQMQIFLNALHEGKKASILVSTEED